MNVQNHLGGLPLQMGTIIIFKFFFFGSYEPSKTLGKFSLIDGNYYITNLPSFIGLCKIQFS
jgi:hypothetical protein